MRLNHKIKGMGIPKGLSRLSWLLCLFLFGYSTLDFAVTLSFTPVYKRAGASDAMSNGYGTSYPSVENAVTGEYDLLVENFILRRNATTAGIVPLASGQLDLYNFLTTAVGNPAILGIAKTPSIPGFAALATYQYDPTTLYYNGQTVLLNPVLRIDNGGNLCAPFQQIQ